MPNADIDVLHGKESKAMLKEVKKFASRLVATAGVELDALPDPGDVIREDSPLWEVFKTHRKLDLHLAGIPESLGGLDDMDWLTPILMAETLGQADPGLAIGLMVSGLPFQYAALFDVPALSKTAKEYCKDYDCTLIGAAPVGTSASPVTATPLRNQYVLNGRVDKVLNAGIATHLVLEVTVHQNNSPPQKAMAVVPLDREGVTRGAPLPKTGQRSLPLASITFQEARMPKSSVVLPDEKEMARVKEIMAARESLYLSSVYSGAALRAWEEAMEYAKKRVQGGTVIFNHKNIRLQLFNMLKSLEAARASTRRLARYHAENPGPVPRAHAAAAKCLSTETATKVASEAIQIFGGYGLTKEFPIEKIFRDARLGMIEHGINEDIALEAMAFM